MFTCGFYDSLNGDRKYNAEQMSSIFDGVITDGVYENVGDYFATIPGNGMEVVVKTGRAWFRHTWSLLDAPQPYSIEDADVVRTRVDAVVLEVDKRMEARTNEIKVITGVPNTDPVKPTLLEGPEIWQYPIAYVTVRPNVTEITETDIEIMVGREKTPFVTSPLKVVSLDVMWKQWEGEFTEWFDHLKAMLNDNIVANLQAQIDENRENIERVETDLGNAITNGGDVGSLIMVSKYYNKPIKDALLCNGGYADPEKYPDLFSLLGYNEGMSITEGISGFSIPSGTRLAMAYNPWLDVVGSLDSMTVKQNGWGTNIYHTTTLKFSVYTRSKQITYEYTLNSSRYGVSSWSKGMFSFLPCNNGFVLGFTRIGYHSANGTYHWLGRLIVNGDTLSVAALYEDNNDPVFVCSTSSDGNIYINKPIRYVAVDESGIRTIFTDTSYQYSIKSTVFDDKLLLLTPSTTSITNTDFNLLMLENLSEASNIATTSLPVIKKLTFEKSITDRRTVGDFQIPNQMFVANGIGFIINDANIIVRINNLLTNPSIELTPMSIGSTEYITGALGSDNGDILITISNGSGFFYDGKTYTKIASLYSSSTNPYLYTTDWERWFASCADAAYQISVPFKFKLPSLALTGTKIYIRSKESMN